MTEPTITCPKCKTEIKLTESLAAPLVEATRKDFEQKLARKDAETAKREESLREQEAELARARASIEDQVARQLKIERSKVAEEEARRAKQLYGTDLESKVKEIETLQTVLQEREGKLAEAQQAQVDLLRKQRELDDAKRELDLTVEKRIQDGLTSTREQARKEVSEEMRLKVLEREETIDSMRKQIDELKQRAEQGSQQLQGEVQELELESMLSARFPQDTIEPVPKGEHGGDVLHRVIGGPAALHCGTILWESKRTKHWSDGWLTKLRSDQRTAKAEVAVIISTALPKDIESFELIDFVWVAHPRVAIPLATVLRQSLLELASTKVANDGLQTKTELVYQYLTGPKFRHRVQAIVEAFSSMEQDLAREKKAIMKQWAKRDTQIARVMEATVGMYGDLQGIAGKTLPEIEGLALPASTEDEEEAD